jgi:hypothetical protein
MDELDRQLADLVDAAEPVTLDEVCLAPLPMGRADRWRRPLVAGALVAAAIAGVLAIAAVAQRDHRFVIETVDTTTTTTHADEGGRPCAGERCAATPSTEASSPPPATSAAPSPPPGLDRDGLSTAGVGELRFGATIAEAEAMTGATVEWSGPDGCGQGHLATLDHEGLALTFWDGRFVWWGVRVPGWRTLSGVEVGMPTDEVLARVPELERHDDVTTYLVLPPLPTNLIVNIDSDDRVDGMVAAERRGLYPYTDLC